LGAAVQPESRGVRILSILPGGPADLAGLSRDDLLIDVDNQSLATEDLTFRLKPYPAGATVPITVERHGRRKRIDVTLDPPMRSQYSIVTEPSATPEQVTLREAWLSAR
jgi:predicted metalloprotease with PDZ domain